MNNTDKINKIIKSLEANIEELKSFTFKDFNDQRNARKVLSQINSLDRIMNTLSYIKNTD